MIFADAFVGEVESGTCAGHPKNAPMVPKPTHLLVGTEADVRVFDTTGKDVTESSGLAGVKPARTYSVDQLTRNPER